MDLPTGLAIVGGIAAAVYIVETACKYGPGMASGLSFLHGKLRNLHSFKWGFKKNYLPFHRYLCLADAQ